MSKKPKRLKKKIPPTEVEKPTEPKIAGKKKPVRTILITVLIVLIALATALFIYVYPILKNMNMDSMEQNPEETISPAELEAEVEIEEASSDLPTAKPMPKVTPEPVFEMKNNEDYGIINIMLFGMDNRYRKTILGGRSDVNIILTLDPQNNEVRMTSIMRDTLIYLPSQDDYNRVNAAIVYEGGPEGAIKTIEEEFLIDIDHYVITSFRGMIEIIDSIGGVEVTLSQNEVWEMNGLIQEMNKLFGNHSETYFVYRKGLQTLNGIQAVAYSRIRKTDGGFMRDSRQKEVLLAAKTKLVDITLVELDTALKTVSDWVKTDLEPAEFIALAMDLYGLRNSTIKTARIPYDELFESVRYKKMAVLQYEKEATLWKMHDFIYNGIE